MLSGTGYPSGENYPAGTGMELFFYPHAGTGNPTGKILWVRVSTTRRVRTRCHLDSQGVHDTWVCLVAIFLPVWLQNDTVANFGRSKSVHDTWVCLVENFFYLFICKTTI
jgi:hypothetical protein